MALAAESGQVDGVLLVFARCHELLRHLNSSRDVVTSVGIHGEMLIRIIGVLRHSPELEHATELEFGRYEPVVGCQTTVFIIRIAL